MLLRLTRFCGVSGAENFSVPPFMPTYVQDFAMFHCQFFCFHYCWTCKMQNYFPLSSCRKIYTCCSAAFHSTSRQPFYLLPSDPGILIKIALDCEPRFLFRIICVSTSISSSPFSVLRHLVQIFRLGG